MTIVHYDADCQMAAEALDIERGIRPYLSLNGPRWDLQRVHVDEGREVLLVLVDPPKAGQPAFPCFKDGPGLNNGQIIVRGDGETRQATGEEVLLLQQRGMPEWGRRRATWYVRTRLPGR